jgi:hypothetical protein
MPPKQLQTFRALFSFRIAESDELELLPGDLIDVETVAEGIKKKSVAMFFLSIRCTQLRRGMGKRYVPSNAKIWNLSLVICGAL